MIHLSDSLFYYKNKEGQDVAKINSLVTENANQFLEIQTKDSIILELQKEVKRNKSKIKDGGSVTIVKTETVIDTLFLNNDSDYHYSDKWIDWNLSLRDSIEFDLSVRNDYSIVIGREKSQYYAEITNQNPYTKTNVFRTYQVTMPKPKKFGLGIQVGYGFEGPYIGIGIQYNLITF